MSQVLRVVSHEVGDAVRAEGLAGVGAILMLREAHEDGLPGVSLGWADERRGEAGDALLRAARGRVAERHGGVRWELREGVQLQLRGAVILLNDLELVDVVDVSIVDLIPEAVIISEEDRVANRVDAEDADRSIRVAGAVDGEEDFAVVTKPELKLRENLQVARRGDGDGALRHEVQLSVVVGLVATTVSGRRGNVNLSAHKFVLGPG
jgi:hypothetical protein